MRVFDGVLQQSCSNQTCGVRHVHHEDGAYLVCDFANAGIVPFAAVGRSACDDQFGTLGASFALQFVVIYQTVRLFYTVVQGVEHQSGEVNRRPMRKVSTVREV